MSEAKKFFKSGMLLTIVGLAMRSAAMLFGAFISRSVGAEGTGLYTLVMTVYSLALTLATSGISLTVTRLVASAVGERRPSQVGRVMSGAIIYSLFFGVLSTLILFFGADLIGWKILSDGRTTDSLRILSFSLIPASLSAVFSGYFVGVKRVGFNAATSVFCQAVKMIFTIILVLRFAPYGIVSAVRGLTLGITLTEILGLFLVTCEYIYDRKKHSTSATKGSEIRRVSRTALPLAFSAYVRAILLNVEHIMIPKKLEQGGESRSEAYSHYGSLHGMALPLITYPMSPLSSFAGLLVPEFAEDMAAGRDGRMSRVASKAINTTLCYALICAVMLYTFAQELGYLLYKSYDSGYYISILATVVPIMYLDHVTDSILKGVGEQVFSMWVNITDSFLSVILVWLLIPRMGIIGYALVIIIMESYNFLLSFFRLRKKIKFKLSIFLPIVAFASAGLSSALTGRIFSFGGASAPVLWLSLKIVFAVSLTVFFISVTGLFKSQIKNDFNKRKTAKEE